VAPPHPLQNSNTAIFHKSGWRVYNGATGNKASYLRTRGRGFDFRAVHIPLHRMRIRALHATLRTTRQHSAAARITPVAEMFARSDYQLEFHDADILARKQRVSDVRL